MANGSTYPIIVLDANGNETEGNQLVYTDSSNQPLPSSNPVTSGSLATVTFSSGTAAQVSTTEQVTVYVPVTYDNSSSDATCKVELSPNNSDFSTLGTITWKTFTNAVSGNIALVPLVVPKAWYVKLTVAHATIGAAAYA